MNKTFLFIILLFTTVHSQTFTEFIHEARENFKDGNYQQAIELYSKVIQLDSTTAIPFYERGMTYNLLLTKNKEKAAREDLSKAIELDPGHALAYFERACIGWGIFNKDHQVTITYSGDDTNLDARIADFSKSILLQEKFFPSYYGRGTAYYNKGQFENAIRDYDSALKLDPDDYSTGMINLIKGRSLMALRKYAEALQCFNTALRININSNSILVQRAYANYHLGNYAKAYRDFEESIRLSGGKNCSNRSPTYYMALIEIILKDYNAAEADLRMLIETCGLDYAPVWLNYSKTFFYRNKYSNAVWCLQQALEKPLSFELDIVSKTVLLNELGTYYLKANDHNNAVKYYTESLAIDSNQSATLQTRGTSYSNLQNYPAALHDFNRAIQLNPNLSYASFFNRGFVRFKVNDFSGALEDFNKAINMYQLPLFYFWRAKTKIMLNEFSEVCDDLQYAVEGEVKGAEEFFNKYCE